jgi:hypothetical protein
LNRGVVGSRGRSLTPWLRNALRWSLVALLVALVVGAIYQTIATEIDQREAFPGPGEMVDVASELVVTMNKAAGVFGPPLARTDISRVFDLYPSHPELPPLQREQSDSLYYRTPHQVAMFKEMGTIPETMEKHPRDGRHRRPSGLQELGQERSRPGGAGRPVERGPDEDSALGATHTPCRSSATLSRDRSTSSASVARTPTSSYPSSTGRETS